MLKSDGSPWRPIVHIEDISRAFLAVLERAARARSTPRPSTSAGTTRTTGSGTSPRSSRRRSPAARSPSPTTPARTSGTTGPTSRRWRSVLPEFQPRWDARKGAKQLLDAYRAIGLELSDFEGSRYRRIDQIKQLLERGQSRPRSSLEERARRVAGTVTMSGTATVPKPACLSCGTPLRHTFVDLGMSPLCECFSPAEQAQPDGAVLSAARLGLRGLLPRPGRGVRQPARHLHRVRLLLLVLRQLGRAHAPLRGDDLRPLRPRAAQLRGRGGQQRRLPAAALRAEAASRCWASSRRRTWPRWPSTRAFPTLVAFFGEALAGELAAEGKQADLICGTNVLAQVPGPQRLRGGIEAAAQARRGDHHRVPPSDAADGGEPVRHHLPRALLVLLLPQRGEHLRAPGAGALRRRGAPDPRRLAADLRPPRRGRLTADHRARADALRQREVEARAPRASRPTPASASR